MGFNISKVFHSDHGIEQSTMQTLVDIIKPEGFFLKTLELPAGVPDAVCGIYGPNVGDAPVQETEVVYKQRTPDRPMSRMVNRPGRPTRQVTIIGMASDEGVTIYTCYGGPAAEREPGDKSLTAPAEIEASKKFWSEHALVLG